MYLSASLKSTYLRSTAECIKHIKEDKTRKCHGRVSGGDLVVTHLEIKYTIFLVQLHTSINTSFRVNFPEQLLTLTKCLLISDMNFAIFFLFKVLSLNFLSLIYWTNHVFTKILHKNRTLTDLLNKWHVFIKICHKNRILTEILYKKESII